MLLSLISILASGKAMKLSTSLCIYMLCICVCIFAGISIVLEKYASTQEEEQIHRLTELLQGQMIRSVEDDLHGVAQNTERTVRELASMPMSINEINAAKLIGIMVESDPLIKGGSIAYVPENAPINAKEWMIYVQRTSSGLTTQQLGDSDYNYTTQQWFTAPIRTGKATWSTPYMDTGAGDCLMTTYSIPVKDSHGHIYAVVTADVALSYLETEADQLRPYKASRSLLLSADGAPLTASVPSDKQTIEQLSKISTQLTSHNHADGEITADGEKLIACCSRIAGPDIIIATLTPYKSALTVIKQIKLPILLIVGCGFILLLIGLRLIIPYVTRPLNRLSNAAISIGNGDFTTSLPPSGPYADIRHLHDAMAYMTRAIQQHITTIAQNARDMQRIESELAIARSIQQGMQPRPLPADGIIFNETKVAVASMLQPAREVSGDMYDYVYADGSLYFIIADVSDKGVPASLVMAAVHTLFRFTAERHQTPREILTCINRHICESNPKTMFVTLITGVIDINKGLLTLANGGHNPPIISDGNGCRYLTLPPGLPAGVMDDVNYTQTSIPFVPGAMIFLYTDGLTEAENSNGIPFGEDRLLSHMEGLHTSKPDDVIASVNESVTDYSIMPLSDDITMMCIGSAPCISLSYDINEITRLANFIDSTACTYRWNADLTQKVNLILEEAVSNIINHSVPTHDKADITVALTDLCGDIQIDITDCSPPFNPLESVPEIDTNMPAEQRSVGGLGLFLISRLVSSAEYEYKDNKNHLRLYLKSSQQ